jgi:chromosome segregation protein
MTCGKLSDPMYLKSLTLKGFKSFADTTTLDFEPGITVVVGPNGSGKSNVVDAVAWVLGAQGARSMRSNKMEDVIFAGTSKRAALGRAEVSLTIDNHSGMLPIAFTEVTIMRTLFRSGESEYAINGAGCRLLDIQELLSDSGVGRQQHVIVGQGQLAAILDSRPEDRRSVIEEAAGVLKFRRRRERAQRRLEATEANFVRLGDLLRELRRQLRPLERQAQAAEKHSVLTEELRALKIFLAGSEFTTLARRSEDARTKSAQFGQNEAEFAAVIEALDLQIFDAEAQLSSIGGGSETTVVVPGFEGHDIGEALSRTEGLYQKARGTLAFLGERRRNIEQQRNRFVDSGVVASLEAEVTRIVGELDTVALDVINLGPQLDDLQDKEESLMRERDHFLEQWGTDTAAAEDRSGPTAAQVRGELQGARATATASAAEVARIDQRSSQIEQRQDRQRADLQRAEQELETLGGGETIDVEAIKAQRTDAEAAVTSAEAALTTAEEAARSADGEKRAWQARADTLAAALDEARNRAGAKRLAGIDGLVGTLLDLVDIDPGWEAAVEAALGEAIGAVVVRDATVARSALARLHESKLSGAVLALDTIAAAAAPTLPLGPVPGDPVRLHVRARRADAEPVLDRLLAHAVAVDGDWSAALDLAVAHPSAVVVTLVGDRYSAAGWRAGSGSVGATGAALDEARAKAEQSAALAATTQATLVEARSSVAEARSTAATARQTEQRSVGEAERVRNNTASLQQTVERITNELAELVGEADVLTGQRAEALIRVETAKARVSELESILPRLEDLEAEASHREARRREGARALDDRAKALATVRRDLEVAAASLEERQRVLVARQGEIEGRLARSVEERLLAEERRQELDLLGVRIELLHGVVEQRAVSLEDGLEILRDARRRQTEAAKTATGRLETLRRERSTTAQRRGENAEKVRALELELAELALRTETLTDRVRTEFEMEPDALRAIEPPVIAEGINPSARARDIERELREMGPVNPLALDEYNEIQERHRLIEAQLEDVKTSRRELAKVIAAIDEEIVTVFAAAYADVEQNFEQLFALLFPGGQGKLKLTDPDNLLDTGVEVEARPSGKNVRKLSLLSGGERSLTALAFLFAVFRSRPSPFYLMDEVEAALDDVNLDRFLTLLQEFRQDAQLLVVSHQKRTMEAADCLYGVTMPPGGSSRAVSEKLSKVRAAS